MQYLNTTKQINPPLALPTKLNRKLRIVYRPKKGMPFHEKGTFYVGVYSLHKYIGVNNAKTQLEKALASLEDKHTVKLRNHGKLYFYFK